MAAKHSKKATELLHLFWQQLINENVEELPVTVVKFDEQCQKVSNIFSALQVKFPKSTAVLRYCHALSSL